MATRDVYPDGRYWLGLRTVVDECSLDARLVEGGDVVAEVGKTGREGRTDVAASDDACIHDSTWRAQGRDSLLVYQPTAG